MDVMLSTELDTSEALSEMVAAFMIIVVVIWKRSIVDTREPGTSVHIWPGPFCLGLRFHVYKMS